MISLSGPKKECYCVNCRTCKRAITPENYYEATTIWNKINSAEEKKDGDYYSRTVTLDKSSALTVNECKSIVRSFNSKYGFEGDDNVHCVSYLGLPVTMDIRFFSHEGARKLFVTAKASWWSSKPFNYGEVIREGEEAFCEVCGTKTRFIGKEAFAEYDRNKAKDYIASLKEKAPIKELSHNKSSVDEQELLKHLVELSGNAFKLEKTLEEILIKKSVNDRTIKRIEGNAKESYLETNQARIIQLEKEIEEATQFDNQDIEIMEKEWGIAEPKLEMERPIPPKKPEVSREDLIEPEKPIPKEAGLFNKSKIERLNKNAELAYEQAMAEYRENIAALEQYENDLRVYDEEMVSFNKSYELYKEKEEEYERKISEYIDKKASELKKQRDKLNNAPERVLKERSEEYLDAMSEDDLQEHKRSQNVSEFYKEEASEIEKMLDNQYSIIKTIESTGVIFPKYNDVVAWNTMYEYFLTGRVDTLSGTNGAYNMYESELRSNAVISKLDVMFFASINYQKLQAKMENLASPFWRKLQAARWGFLSTA